MNHDHEFTVRPWGMACRCGEYLDMGRPATQAEMDWEALARKEGREITERLLAESMERQEVQA